MPDVRLVDLDVIKRFSLAVRRDAVPAEELLASLDASRAVVVKALGGPAEPKTATRTRTGTGRRASADKPAAPKMAAPATRRRATGS
jgi:hypothetical protein